uniref:CCR4-NOT transcription complex subunit 1 n=1 Tax=Acrobeloides nanus TaxID=290746 RepID=A0A914DTZ4_9BILA
MDILGVRNPNMMAPQMMPELGINFTNNIDICKDHIMKILAEERDNLDPILVARLISIIILNHRHQTPGTRETLILNALFDSSSTSWNAKVFVTAVKQLAPTLNWVDVLANLDQPLFNVRNKHALQLLTQIFLEAFDSDYGRMHLISQNLYRIWNGNKAGQLSWIAQIVQNSDVFCFADLPHRPVNCSSLKVLPDDNNKDIGNWRCLELVEVLLRLSELSPLYNSACALLKPPGPISMCPDVLMLALVQVPPPITNLRMILIKQLLPIFIMGHANAVPVLNAAWNADASLKQIVKQLILQAFLDYYGNGDDQTRLTRVLEIAHELKPNGLTELFALNQFQFVIDLACLAARRDFLKLDKFLDDKINEYGDAFAQSISFYLKRKCPMGLKAPGALPERDAQTLLSALQLRATYSTVIANELNQLTSHFRTLQLKYEEAVMAQRMPIDASNQASYNPLLGSVPANSSFPNVRPQEASTQFLNRQSSFLNNPIKAPADPMKNNMFGGGLPGLSSPLGSFDALRASPQLQRNPQIGAYSGAMPFRGPSGGMSGWNSIPSTIPTNSVTPFGFKSQLPMNRDPFSTTPSLVASSQSRADVLSNLNPSRSDENSFAALQFSDDIQEAANRYFQQIYARCDSMTIQDFINKLKAFKSSPDQRDKDILTCIIKNLFDEYRFFHEYPGRELKTTAELYGGIIREGIVANIQFAIALRRVIESLQSEMGSTLWNFGVVALNACRACLFRYPKVCQMLKNVSSFERFPAPLKEYIVHGEQNQLPPSHIPEEETEKSVAAQSTTAASNFKVPNRGGTSILTTANVDILLNAIEREGTQLKDPPAEVVEKVAFLCNNLSQTNLAKKTEEMNMIIQENGEDFTRWLARYLVTKRVTLEQNFQPLYNNFLIALNDPVLDKCIKEETYRNIKVLLRSDKRHAASNFGDRQLLKNLGHWLGTITIARDRPIITNELDLKSLLLEAFYKGQQELLYVVPFVAKVLLSCTKSSVFAPKCSWIGGILNVLAEIHNEPDLKLNLKFEIEVLCKDLKADLQSLETRNILKDTERLLRVPQQLGDLALLKQPDSVPVRASPMLLQARLAGARTETPTTMGGQNLTVSHLATPVSDSEASISQATSETYAQPSMPPTTATLNYNDINVLSLDGLMQYLNIPNTLPLFLMHPALQHICKPAISQAVKELIGGITDRAINVAITVTEEICKKDFALDQEEQNMRRASQQMMRSMTAAMASITCREPLANTIHGYLKQFFYNQLPTSASNPNEMKLIEEAAIIITENNLEVAINFIVKTACEKATVELDKSFEKEYSERQACAKEGKPFPTNPSVLEIQEALPESIRIKVGPVSQEQMKIYDDYSSKICGFRPTRVEDMLVDFAKMRTDTGTTPMPFNDAEQFQNQLQLIVREVDTLLIHNQPASMSKAYVAISETRDVIHMLAKNHKDPFAMSNLISRLVDRFLFAYEVNPEAMRASNSAELNERLRELFLGIFRILLSQVEPNTLIRRVTRAVMDCSHEYRFNADAMDVIIKHQLINISLFDQHLKALMDNGSNFQATYFAQKVVKLYLLDQTRFVPVANVFPHTCDVLSKLQPMLASSQLATTSFTPNVELGGIGSSRPASTTIPQHGFGMEKPSFMGMETPMDRRLLGQDADMQQKVELILREWINICYTPITLRDPQQALAMILRM